MVAGALKALEIVARDAGLRARLMDNTRAFRARLTATGFNLRPGEHPIVPVMLHEAQLAQRMAETLLAEGVPVIAFAYPVVPEGQARIRAQLNDAHAPAHLDQSCAAFARVGRRQGCCRSDPAPGCDDLPQGRPVVSNYYEGPVLPEGDRHEEIDRDAVLHLVSGYGRDELPGRGQ
jgi:glycine C-acetyltransferase